MRRISLSNSDKSAVVSDSDYERLARYRWRLHPKGRVVRNCVCRRRGWRGRVIRYWSCVYLHREIAGLERGDKLVVYHLDGDYLNNRRENLAIGTRSQMQRAWRKRPGATSRFRGLSRSSNGWIVRIRADNRVHYLGYFPLDQEELAARAYDEAARTLHGGFATLNFAEAEDRETEASSAKKSWIQGEDDRR